VLESSNSEKPLIDAMFNVLPQTLIILMPLFALMLKNRLLVQAPHGT